MADNKTTLDKLKKYPLASDLDDDEYLQQLIDDSWTTVQADHIKPVKQEEANRLWCLVSCMWTPWWLTAAFSLPAI